jgi:hypothetical protein
MCEQVYELRHWTQHIHEPVLIEHIHLLQTQQIMYNDCTEKI